MNNFFSKIANLRPMRFLIAAVFCTLLFVANTLPAAAATSSPDKGVTPLQGIEQKSQDVLKEGPRDLEKTQSEAQKGLNAVQGGADYNKLNRPENAKSTSVEEQIKEGLRDLTSK